MTTPEEIKAEYTSSLADLTFNSKPLINMLTMLAEENLSNAKVIVEAIETHLSKVNTDVKLPILYLIDCIVKNVGRTYTSFFAQNIVQTFCNVFKVVDEKTRAEMFKLRQTWNDVFPQTKLYAIDVKINMVDPAWPVTAQPSSSIHFNPKFFNPATSTTPTAKVSNVVTPAVPTPAVGNIDKETLLMQEKLIQKQKELLELQQKKLELEVLQTKVKLQEQIKAVNPPNILMKPEVAKQLIPDAINSKANKPMGIGSSVMQQRLQNNLGNQPNRINPASPALASARPIRDPRLLRQQQKSNNNAQSNSSSLGAQLGQKSASSNLENNNKNVTSKLGVKDIRKDPRLLSNKSDSTSNKQTSKTSPKSRPQVLQSLDAEQVTNKTLKLSARSSIKTGTDFDKSSLSSRSSSSSLDSPTKYNKSINSSPRKNKKNKSEKQQLLLTTDESINNISVPTNKNSVIASSVTKESLNNKRDKPNFILKRDSPNSFKNINNTIEGPLSNSNVSSSNNSTFRGVKKSTKDRNYIRRNKSESPEPPQDEDLRSFAAPPEKQARMQSDSAEEKVTSPPAPLASAPKEIDPLIPTNKGMDVDLRQLPAIISKKRTSTEAPESGSAKKSKSEMFDVLFGNEDTDLRQLPVNTDRPPTPPPPIISTSDPVSQNSTPKDSPKKTQNNDFEAIRAKLANATSKDKLTAKSFHKKKLAAAAAALEDQDLRVPTVSSTTDLPRNAVFISPEDERKIKSGMMTKEQQALLLNKIFMQIEKGKLQEAKEKDKEDSIGNISLQPISDDELDLDESLDESRGGHVVSYNDKDERFRPPHFHSMQQGNEHVPTSGPGPQHQMPPQQQFYPRDQRPRYPSQPWRGGPNWRGRGRGINAPMMPMARPPIRPPRMGGPPKWRNMSPNFPQPPVDYIPPQDDDSNTDMQVERDKMANTSLLQCEIKTINIDGTPRDIRYYIDTAVVFLNWDDPRDISFQAGVRRVIFNDSEIYVMSFGDPYKECMVNGVVHRVKLGGPSKEIFIDDVGYECFFGGAAINVETPSGESFTVHLEGPIPQVKIGDVKRTDLVAGKINLILNAKLIVPVFLDGKLQRVVIDGETCTLRFVDALRTVLINDVPFNVEFGGLPKPFTINGRKHFIRFSVLPKGVRPGYVRIRDMEGQALGEGFSPRMDETSQDGVSGGDGVITMERLQKRGLTTNTGGESPDGRSNSPSFFQNLLQPNSNNFDVLSNALSNTMVPAAPPTTGGYQIENIPPQTSDIKDVTSKPIGPMIPPVNINDLFQKLVASGFVQSEVEQPKPPVPVAQIQPVVTIQNAPVKPVIPEKPTNKNVEPDNNPPLVKSLKRSMIERLRPVTFARPETFKFRQGALYLALYTGLQCSSCGMRFPPESSTQYSQHLDWHFRQNRRGKKNIRVASSRRWYYSLADWKNYEEIEDLEEREKNYFDQQQQAETVSEDMEEDVEVPSVPADPASTDQRCEVCRDKLDQFFHEEREEWHLRNAIEVDGKIYHPVCYDDYQQSLLECSVEELKSESEVKPKESAIIPGLEIILDDDDEEDRLTAPSPTPGDVVSLGESDESKPPTEAPQGNMDNQDEDDDDDDVILNEVAPIKIVVEDDDEDETATQNSEKSQQKMEQTRIKREKHVDDDGFVDVGEGLVSLNKVGQIKIKSEPMDDDSQVLKLPTPTPEETPLEPDWSRDIIELSPPHPDFDDDTYIDGNDELASSAPPAINPSVAGVNRIKINISKPLAVINKEKDAAAVLNDSVVGVNEPYPPGEEPEIVHFKPELQGVALQKLPPVTKGAELTGLCSIM